jgi:predicted flavoprotein YhiN
VQKTLKLSKGAEALLLHLTPGDIKQDLDRLLATIKHFPLQLTGRQSLDESISSSGGVVGTELTELLMLKKFPGIFLAGEMIDWDAPTGGFLLQGCVAMGKRAGQGIVSYLKV